MRNVENVYYSARSAERSVAAEELSASRAVCAVYQASLPRERGGGVVDENAAPPDRREGSEDTLHRAPARRPEYLAAEAAGRPAVAAVYSMLAAAAPMARETAVCGRRVCDRGFWRRAGGGAFTAFGRPVGRSGALFHRSARAYHTADHGPPWQIAG